MGEPTPFERSWKEKHDVFARKNPEYLEHIKASVGYGQLAVRSALLLNGGALFALPAFISTASRSIQTAASPQVEPSTILSFAAGSFVLGIILSALCAYVAYWNFQHHARQVWAEREGEVIDIEEAYDGTHQHRLKDSRERTRNLHSAVKSDAESWINRTTWGGQVLGIASYIAFCLGCYFTGRIILGL